MIDFVGEQPDPEEAARTTRQRNLYGALQTIAERTTAVRERLNTAWKEAKKDYPSSDGHDFHVLLRGALLPFEEVTTVNFEQCMDLSIKRAVNIKKTNAKEMGKALSGDEETQVTARDVDNAFMEITVKPVLLAPRDISETLLNSKERDVQEYFTNHPEVKADFVTFKNQVKDLVKQLDLVGMAAALSSPQGYRSI